METALKNLMEKARETKQTYVISLPSMFGHLYTFGKVDKGVTWTATTNEHGAVELTYKNN